jgi:hypothetical protein
MSDDTLSKSIRGSIAFLTEARKIMGFKGLD